MHGFSDDASAWVAVGRANVIFDNLIAQGKAKPMLIVMPLGYGAPEIVTHRGPGFRDAGLRQRNFDKFREALLSEVLPQVEKTYRVSKDRNSRAIAGLSMGGADDRLIEPNRKFREFLKSKDIRFIPIETPGAHNWMVWRRNLAEFGSLLFHDKT